MGIKSCTKAYLSENRLECGKVGKANDPIDQCRYSTNCEHAAVDVLLKKDLTVFGMRHPSSGGGFKLSNYADKLKTKLK